jgi:hypothetical protein
MFDVMGKPKAITELDGNEAAAIAKFEVHGELQGTGESRKAVGLTMKIKFTDRLTALALLGKACHYYADRQELTGADGHPLPPLTGLTIEFVEAPPRRSAPEGYQPQET